MPALPATPPCGAGEGSSSTTAAATTASATTTTASATTTTASATTTTTGPSSTTGGSTTGTPANTLTAQGGVQHDCWANDFSCVTALQTSTGPDGTYDLTWSNIQFNGRGDAGLMFWSSNTDFIRFTFWTDGSVTQANIYQIVGNSGSTVESGHAVTLNPTDIIRVVKSGTSYSFQVNTQGSFSAVISTVTFSKPIYKVGPYVGNCCGGTSQTVSATVAAFTQPVASYPLSAPAGSVHDCWANDFSCVTHLLAAGADGTYTLTFTNVALNAQADAGLMFWSSNTNFIRFTFWTQSGASGIQANVYKVYNNQGSAVKTGTAVGHASTMAIQVVKSGSSYAFSVNVGSGFVLVTNTAFTTPINQVGPYIGNCCDASAQAASVTVSSFTHP